MKRRSTRIIESFKLRLNFSLHYRCRRITKEILPLFRGLFNDEVRSIINYFIFLSCCLLLQYVCICLLELNNFRLFLLFFHLELLFELLPFSTNPLFFTVFLFFLLSQLFIFTPFLLLHLLFQDILKLLLLALLTLFFYFSEAAKCHSRSCHRLDRASRLLHHWFRWSHLSTVLREVGIILVWLWHRLVIIVHCIEVVFWSIRIHIHWLNIDTLLFIVSVARYYVLIESLHCHIIEF